MVDGNDQIVAAAAAVVGPCRVVRDLSWPHGESRVVELETATGRRLVGKAHRQADKFSAELTALERWVPLLGRHAPELIAAHGTSHVLVMSRLDASPFSALPDGDQRDAYHQAGDLLARFHGAAPSVRLTGFAAAQRRRFDTWLRRDRDGVLTQDEVSFVAEHVGLLDDLPDPFGVPCHRDWQPRNWLIGTDGQVMVIDFEHARIGPWFEDLTRLWWNEWVATVGLADAFFAGYGRALTHDETRSLVATSLLGHLTTIVWAHEHGDEAFGEHARKCIAAARQDPDSCLTRGPDAMERVTGIEPA